MLARGVKAGGDEILVRVLKQSPSQKEYLARTTRELQVTQLLGEHPLVLRYHDVDLIANRYCIITEHVPHPSLERLLLGRQRLPYPAILNVMKSLVTLLALARTNGLRERQINLEDLLIDPETGATKLVKLSTPRSLTVKGAAPRAAQASLVGDMYFLGCTLFRLLTLEHAFTGLKTVESVAIQRCGDGIKAAFSTLSAGEVERLVALFTRLTTRDIAGHFESLEQVGEELAQLESLNADIAKARQRADAFQRRAKKVKLTETAYDTVAAFAGKVQVPREDAPSRADPDPQMKGAHSLLWGRQRVAEGGAEINWDDPAVIKTVVAGSIGLFFAMLFWLLFSH